MSFMIYSVRFMDEGRGGPRERGAKARKERMAIEEMKRKEAAAGLLLFAGGSKAVPPLGGVSVGA
jgi:hypothetical protein